MNRIVDSSPSGNKWNFSHQAGIGWIFPEFPFPHMGLCSIQVQDITSAPSEFMFHVRPKGMCPETGRKALDGAGCGLGFSTLRTSIPQVQLQRETVSGCGDVDLFIVLYSRSNCFFILKVIAIYFRIFKKYQRKHKMKIMYNSSFIIYPCPFFLSMDLNFSSAKMWSSYVHFSINFNLTVYQEHVSTLLTVLQRQP